MEKIVMESPLGEITIAAKGDKLIFITYGEISGKNTQSNVLLAAKKQLEEYFEQKRTSFDLPLSIEGTSFQKKVWEALRSIPYGETCSYQDVAIKMDNPKAVRAVGQANRKNPFPIIVPCHRVIGKNKKLIGYAGNQTDKQQYLLSLENSSNSVN
ncbi:methylated-DNA--[protein]-cysteine S-methyltransferase [Bacillus spongiae]|uniref:Methylated-DNA--protein-cysteine methyltransferase n=1 Tax=Bacillus spongiae TaxID=2683610 RepID=A0ABU8H9C6_9BACI